MQSTQKYLSINTWCQHILNHNLQPIEKDRKNKQAGHFGSLYS